MNGKIAKYMGTYKGYPLFFKIETSGDRQKQRELENELFKKINMKTTTYIQIVIVGLIIVFILFLNITMIELYKEIEDTQAKPCATSTEYVYIKDLPPLHFNWTPINERTERPTPLPVIHFNELEK